MFGNITAAYAIRDVKQVEVLRFNERYADALQVGFLGYHRSDESLHPGRVRGEEAHDAHLSQQANPLPIRPGSGAPGRDPVGVLIGTPTGFAQSVGSRWYGDGSGSTLAFHPCPAGTEPSGI